MKPRFVLDAWALVALLQAEEPAASHVRRLLEMARNGQADLFASMINIGEVTYIVGKSAGISKAWQALEYVRSLSLSVLSVSDEAVIAAARNKIEHPISYADAFAVAAARDLGARLVTGDPELLRLEGPVRIEMLSRDSSYD